jgi:hypothetical protein
MFEPETPLILARRHVKEGAQRVEEQRVRIEGMEVGSQGFDTAHELLDTMETLQEAFVSDLARLEALAG